MREILSWDGDVGLMAAIASVSVLTADNVPWSDLREGRGWGFGGDPHIRWMVLWDLMLGQGEAPVLNDLPLWELAEVLLERRRVEFGGNGDDHLKGWKYCGRRSSRWRRWWILTRCRCKDCCIA